MGFFKDFKDDFSQAVNELLPGDDGLNDDDMLVNTLEEEVDVESELSKLDGLLEQVTRQESARKPRQTEDTISVIPLSGRKSAPEPVAEPVAAQPQPEPVRMREPEPMPVLRKPEPVPIREPEPVPEEIAESVALHEPEPAVQKIVEPPARQTAEPLAMPAEPVPVHEPEPIPVLRKPEPVQPAAVQPEPVRAREPEPVPADITESLTTPSEPARPAAGRQPVAEPASAHVAGGIAPEQSAAAGQQSAGTSFAQPAQASFVSRTPQQSRTAFEEVKPQAQPAPVQRTAGAAPVRMPQNIRRTTVMKEDKKMADVSNINDKVPGEEVTVITEGTVIKGDIMSNGSLDVRGQVEGNVACQGKLTVTGTVNGNSNASEFFADAAKVEGEVVSTGTVKIGLGSVIIGNVTSTSAVIAGAIKGDIDVQGPVVVDTSAVVMGNIKSRSVQINNGAVIEGFCSQAYSDVDVESLFAENNKAATVQRGIEEE